MHRSTKCDSLVAVLDFDEDPSLYAKVVEVAPVQCFLLEKMSKYAVVPIADVQGLHTPHIIWFCQISFGLHPFWFEGELKLPGGPPLSLAQNAQKLGEMEGNEMKFWAIGQGKTNPWRTVTWKTLFFLTKKGIFLHFATCTQLWLITFIFSFPVRPRWPQVKIESPPPQVIGAVGPKQGLELPKILGWIFR